MVTPRRTIIGIITLVLVASGCADGGGSGGGSAAPTTTIATTTTATTGGLAWRLVPAEDAAPDEATLQRAAEVVRSRLEGFGYVGTLTAVEDGAVVVRGLPEVEAALVRATVPGIVEVRAVLERTVGGDTVTEPGGPDEEIVVADVDEVLYRLAPSAFDQHPFESATARLDGANWAVEPVFKEGDAGIGRFNALAGRCYEAAPECPGLGGDRGSIALVLDGSAVAVPTINAPSFERDQVVISGAFDEREARDLAALLGSGPLPVPLTPA